MEFLKSGIKTVLGGTEPGQQPSAAETVEKLVDRVYSSTLLEDRRDACRALKALSRIPPPIFVPLAIKSKLELLRLVFGMQDFGTRLFLEFPFSATCKNRREQQQVDEGEGRVLSTCHWLGPPSLA